MNLLLHSFEFFFLTSRNSLWFVKKFMHYNSYDSIYCDYRYVKAVNFRRCLTDKIRILSQSQFKMWGIFRAIFFNIKIKSKFLRLISHKRQFVWHVWFSMRLEMFFSFSPIILKTYRPPYYQILSTHKKNEKNN